MTVLAMTSVSSNACEFGSVVRSASGKASFIGIAPNRDCASRGANLLKFVHRELNLSQIHCLQDLSHGLRDLQLTDSHLNAPGQVAAAVRVFYPQGQSAIHVTKTTEHPQ